MWLSAYSHECKVNFYGLLQVSGLDKLPHFLRKDFDISVVQWVMNQLCRYWSTKLNSTIPEESNFYESLLVSYVDSAHWLHLWGTRLQLWRWNKCVPPETLVPTTRQHNTITHKPQCAWKLGPLKCHYLCSDCKPNKKPSLVPK